MPNFEALRARLKESQKKLRAMLDKAEAGGRDLSATEKAAYDEELKALADIKKSIELRLDFLEWESARATVAPFSSHSAEPGPIKSAVGVPIEILRKRLGLDSSE